MHGTREESNIGLSQDCSAYAVTTKKTLNHICSPTIQSDKSKSQSRVGTRLYQRISRAANLCQRIHTVNPLKLSSSTTSLRYSSLDTKSSTGMVDVKSKAACARSEWKSISCVRWFRIGICDAVDPLTTEHQLLRRQNRRTFIDCRPCCEIPTPAGVWIQRSMIGIGHFWPYRDGA